MELINYVKTIDKNILKDLELKLNDIIENILFISDYWHLTIDEIKINNDAFQWYHKIPEILDHSRDIIEVKTKEFQDFLKSIAIFLF